MAKGQAKGRQTKFPPKKTKAEQPRAESSTQQTPFFCFRYADMNSRNSWKFEPDASEAPALFKFLCDIGRSTWAEIERAQTGTLRRHRKHHSQPVSAIAGAAIQDIQRLKLDEIFGDEIFRFRLSGEKRIWGFRVDRTFHVVWWDPHHKVYETERD